MRISPFGKKKKQKKNTLLFRCPLIDNGDFGAKSVLWVLRVALREKRDKESLRRWMVLPSTLVPQIFKVLYTNPLMPTSSHSMQSRWEWEGLGWSPAARLQRGWAVGSEQLHLWWLLPKRQWHLLPFLEWVLVGCLLTESDWWQIIQWGPSSVLRHPLSSGLISKTQAKFIPGSPSQCCMRPFNMKCLGPWVLYKIR